MLTKELQYAVSILEDNLEDLNMILLTDTLLEDVKERLLTERIIAEEAIKQLKDLG